MKFFIDSADISEIRSAQLRGWVDGVTTNPSLVAKTGLPFFEVIKSICKEVSGPVSAEVIGLEADQMLKEGLELAKLADNVVVKIPMTENGMIAVKKLTAEGIKPMSHCASRQCRRFWQPRRERPWCRHSLVAWTTLDKTAWISSPTSSRCTRITISRRKCWWRAFAAPCTFSTRV